MKTFLFLSFFLITADLRSDGLKDLVPAVEANLRQEVLAVWFPACVDEARGGFHQNFAEDWTRQWDFTQKHQLDPQPRGWRAQVSLESTPKPGAAKGDGWTESYHQSRALLNVRRMLREMTE